MEKIARRASEAKAYVPERVLDAFCAWVSAFWSGRRGKKARAPKLKRYEMAYETATRSRKLDESVT